MKKIYVITPSSNIKDEMDINHEIEQQIKKSEEIFSSIWIDFIYGELFKKSYKWYWWTENERIDEIYYWFKNSNIDFIISSQWWYNVNSILDKLDYEFIKDNYKPLIGLSDITILLNAIFKKTWKITYHGYDYIRQIWKSNWEYTIKALDNFLNNWLLESSIKWLLLNDIKKWKWILIWWCIPSYSLILWTEYDPIELNKDFIFFIEDIGENYERIMSYIDQLLLNNKFKLNCKWFIIWNFSFCKFENNKEYNFDEILKDKLSFLNISILKIDNIWHVVENPILPIWKKVEINGNNLTIL